MPCSGLLKTLIAAEAPQMLPATSCPANPPKKADRISFWALDRAFVTAVLSCILIHPLSSMLMSCQGFIGKELQDYRQKKVLAVPCKLYTCLPEKYR